MSRTMANKSLQASGVAEFWTLGGIVRTSNISIVLHKESITLFTDRLVE